MGWSDLGVLMLGLCCAAPVVWGQEYVNIARGKTYNQSSTFYTNSELASNAADGNTASYFRSGSDNNPFWEVDLGRKYPVQNINVWGYNSGSSDVYLYPFTITVDDQDCVRVRFRPTSGRNHSVACSSPLYGQKVRLTKTYNGNGLRVCEFEILACTPGLYGDNCNQTCRPSKCLDNTCHPDTGLCIECGGNFIGSTCSECKAGYYRSGDSCYPCSGLCAGSQCDPSNGSCIGCVDGRHGATCNTTCSPAGCQTCHQHSGHCTACKPLYNLDPTSQCKACKEGFSKHNSSICSPCSTSCKDRKCNGDTGDCTQGCRPGFHGDKCEESCSDKTNQCVQCTKTGQCTACSGHFQPPQCTACREGFYNKTQDVDHCTECTWKCHNNTSCNNSTGGCDKCEAGWEGPRCLQQSSQQSSVPVVGAILGAGLMLTVAVLSVLVFLWSVID